MLTRCKIDIHIQTHSKCARDAPESYYKGYEARLVGELFNIHGRKNEMATSDVTFSNAETCGKRGRTWRPAKRCMYLTNNPQAERAARRTPQPHGNSRPTVRKQDSCLFCRWSPHKYRAEATATLTNLDRTHCKEISQHAEHHQRPKSRPRQQPTQRGTAATGSSRQAGREQQQTHPKWGENPPTSILSYVNNNLWQEQPMSS